jgi:hypothetical protein
VNKTEIPDLIIPVLAVWRLTTIQIRANASAGDSMDSFAMKMEVQ